MATRSTLFSDESDIEDNVPSANGDEIHINKNYANYYESFRRKEELQKLKDKQSQLKSYDDSYSEGSSYESMDEELIKPTVRSLDVLANTLLALRNGNLPMPEKETACQNGYSVSPEKKKRKKKEAVYTMDTHRRETNWSTGEGGEVSDDDKEPSFPERKIGPGLSLQHRTIDNLLTEKGVHSDEDPLKDSRKNTLSPRQSTREDLNNRLKQALYRPNMTEDEQILANYILKQKQQMEEESDSEDELRRQGNCRRKHHSGVGDLHGFVYEDEAEETRRTMRETLASFEGAGPSLDQQRPKSYPAVLESTVRIKDDKRRQRRLKDAERKAAEKQRLRQQVQQLQAIKRKEIQDRLKKIQEISGQTRLAFNEDDLDDEFDPDAHDRKMQETFGENYYVDGADNKKPVFDYDKGIDDDMGDYDGYQVHAGDEEDDDTEVPSSSKHGNHDPEEGEYPEEHDAEASAPADGGEEGGSSRRRRGKRRRNDQLSQALLRKKPLFDPEQHDFDEYFDEYYALNFEDVIAGGEVKCRFRYKQVEPNNFGLSTEEILVADDKELNRWCGLKKILKIDRTKEEEERDRKVYKAKGQNIAYKKKMLPTLFKPPEEEVDTETVIDIAAAQRAEEEKKKKKNLKKKLRKQRKLEEEEKKNEEDVADNSEEEKDDVDRELDTTATKSIKSKSNKRKRAAVDDDEGENIDQQEKDEDDEPKAKKLVHSSITVLKAKKSKADDLHKFNKKMKKRRCEEEAKLQSEGLVPKQKVSQRKSRKELVVGDAFSTVLKLSDERLAAYNISGLSKIKKQARYQEKMAERGQQPDFKKSGKGGKEKSYIGKGEKSHGKHTQKTSETKDKSKKHKKSNVNNNDFIGDGEASKSKNKKSKSKRRKEST